ncbi:conserved hypothetical protein [Pediculus humanus corporis]|uniref:Nonsense-mediated mRNA decay factor SMG8 n=1 Tax=Pediculus humanus subsp. corporis TaxID=121224 RepID=E0VLC2_PEDHC|nr:uncharacterized protein Phum_PHUM285740 [Pediculus humanus corporis]EEB14178.1 conserved hypothetical protein [Pediculus humanus corporis]
MVMKSSKIFFDLTNGNFSEYPVESGKKLVVVSFFGKSLQEREGVKNDNFKIFTGDDRDSNVPLKIEGCHDVNQNIVYLHLKGVLDIHRLANVLDEFSSSLNEKGYLTTWANLKHDYARALLFLFSISHVLVVCHPVPVFDLNYIHLFRALDAVRMKTFSKLSELLGDINGLPKEWYENGRPCSPRMLFKFDSCPKGVKDIKKLEHALEDQIYHILKRCNLVYNISSNSLFAIPVNQEFVFIETHQEYPPRQLNKMMNNIIDNCLSTQPKINVLKCLTVEHEMKQAQNLHCFDKFLGAHINLAFTKGFNDNVSRLVQSPSFTLVPSEIFFEIVKRTHGLLVGSKSKEKDSECSDDDEQLDIFEVLRNRLDIDANFSESRCSKVLPLAVATYQQNSPFHYTREFHENKASLECLAQAMSVLAMHGRGSMIDKYAAQLEKECVRHWQNGRQMCQVLSLTGHPCTNGIHRGGSLEGVVTPSIMDSTDRNREGLEVKEHSSGVRYVSTCNCGRRQGPRPDPYTLKAANYEFYSLLADDCGCDEFDVIRFPVFQPSTKDYKAAQLLGRRGDCRNDLIKSEMGTTGTPQEPFSLAYVSGQSDVGSDVTIDPRLSIQQTGSKASDLETVIHVSNNNNEDKDKSLIRQPSTTEYLPTMLHTESPSGLLPQFSSWSLVCLGPSSLYSHNVGLQDQPGLIPGSTYLLPWDVTVRLEHDKKGICSAEVTESRKTNVMRVRKNKADQSEFVVKIFVGVEYECPRGHRFMAVGPDKIMKTTNCGQLKDTAQKVTSVDMPLYFPCVCRSNKPLIAQLMRIHMITPKAPVRVTLNPRVQPSPNSPIFVASSEQPIVLTQSAYWVLRLPFVYMGDQGPYLPPQEHSLSQQGKFLSGCYGITEIRARDTE